MKNKTVRAFQLLFSLLLFAAGGRPGGLEFLVQQIEIMGARQWLGLIAGSAIAPVSQHIPGALSQRLVPFAGPESPSAGAT